MNPILQEYCQRFVKEKTPKSAQIDSFYTSIDIEKHFEKLPFLCDIDNFCLRLYLAMIQKQKICIYSDYDTDAITATGTMYRGLVELGFDWQNLEYYAPDRFAEGYGMNTMAVAELAQKFDLIISVDCGINSTQEAELVKTTNCDLIITDHHHLADQTPDCVAVVNCRLAGDYAKNTSELGSKYVQTHQVKNQELLDQIQKLEPNQTFSKIKTWNQKMQIDPNLYNNKPERFLTNSATGVGVAWFCLVWFGYFLEWMEQK
jgi:hypothetical protein